MIAPIDTIVMYSRSLNEAQNDAGGNASNSLFVTELLENLEIRNLNASQALAQTRFAISAKTNDEQGHG